MDNLSTLRSDCAKKQRRGLHFILASIVIWAGITVVHITNLDITTRNLLTFCFSAPLLPLAFLISKLLMIDFQGKSNPLTSLGIYLSFAQIPYLLIAMWVFAAVPDKMLMVYTIIFGAHLLPYSWLYQSRSYLFFSIFIPLLALGVGLYCSPYWLAVIMLSVEIVFSCTLYVETKITHQSTPSTSTT